MIVFDMFIVPIVTIACLVSGCAEDETEGALSNTVQTQGTGEKAVEHAIEGYRGAKGYMPPNL